MAKEKKLTAEEIKAIKAIKSDIINTNQVINK
jgi:LysM repeat protein